MTDVPRRSELEQSLVHLISEKVEGSDLGDRRITEMWQGDPNIIDVVAAGADGDEPVRFRVTVELIN